MTLPARNEYTCPRGCCHVAVISHGPRVRSSIVLNGKATTIREIARLGTARITVQSIRGRLERGGCLRTRRQNRGRPAPRRKIARPPIFLDDIGPLAAKFIRLPRARA